MKMLGYEPLSEAGLFNELGEWGAASWIDGELRRLWADVLWLLSLANFSIIDSSSQCTCHLPKKNLN